MANSKPNIIHNCLNLEMKSEILVVKEKWANMPPRKYVKYYSGYIQCTLQKIDM